MDVSEWVVLAVEDEPDGQEVVIGLLAHFGVQVDMVGSAEEALHFLNERAYHAVIVDLALPGMDGLTLLHTIRSNEFTAALPCLVITAYHSSLVKKQAFDAGCNAYLTKPLQETDLYRELSRLLGDN